MKNINSSSNLNHVDYLVIYTGYTSRILRADLAKLFEQSSFDYQTEVDGKYVNEKGEIMPSTNQQVLDHYRVVYIKDTLWGSMTDTKEFKPNTDGIYAIGTSEQVDLAKRIVTQADEDESDGEEGLDLNLDGIVVCRDYTLTQAFQFVEFLISEVDYCGCLSLSTMYGVEIRQVDDKKVLFLLFDCESG